MFHTHSSSNPASRTSGRPAWRAVIVALVAVLLAVGIPLLTPLGGAQALSVRDTLWPGEVLKPGTSLDRLTSRSGQYVLLMQGDGNLVLYRAPFRAQDALWWTSTVNHLCCGPGSAVMQGDGNFVVRAPDGGPLWDTHTWGNENPQLGASIVLQDDGNLVIYSSSTSVIGRHPLWARSGRTGGGGPANFQSRNVKVCSDVRVPLLGGWLACIESLVWWNAGTTSGSYWMGQSCDPKGLIGVIWSCSDSSKGSWKIDNTHTVDWVNQKMLSTVAFSHTTECVYLRIHSNPVRGWTEENFYVHHENDSMCPG
jgi:hypothetical protein